MTRRDTILIAVLINAGLLIILFASALTSNSASTEVAAAPAPRVIEPSVKKEVSLNGGDEVDRVLAAAPLAPSQPSMSLAAVSTPAPMSFVDDLKTLTTVPTAPTFTPALLQEKKNDDFVEVKVKKGDVLEKIARAHHTSVEEIISYNHLASTHLRINQTLKIPKKKTTSPEVKTVAAVAEPKYYIVKNGDNPWTIAVKNHMKVEDLLKLNNLDQEKARKLKPGDKLKIE